MENLLFSKDMSGQVEDEDWFIIRDLLELRRKQINKIIDEVLTN